MTGPVPAPGRRRGLWIGSIVGALVVGITVGAVGVIQLGAVGDAGRAVAPASVPTSSRTPATSSEPAPAPSSPVVASAQGFLSTDGATIVDSDGSPVVLKAVSWFGLETQNCVPHGLWTRSMDEVLDQIHGFGFTTIRLPWSNQCIGGAAPNSIDESKNPDLAGRSALEIMDAVVAGARARDMTVLLDRHRPGYDQQSELWYTDAYPEQQWIDDWVMLAERYLEDPTVIGADLHNEPHGPACWGCGDAALDWAAAATRAGNAILAVQPSWLVVVEGVERMGDGTSTWWGGGLSDVRDHPITLDVPDRVVYSTHEYPASVYPQPWFADPTYPENLRPLWDTNWGYLVHEDIAPVLVGELGTHHETESDRSWLAHLVPYLLDGGFSFAYWSYNPNSSDTGGLVQDDWVTPQQGKLDALAPLLREGRGR
ncbi:glycoside hydrolase family 5 protein [Actinotalea sp. K2]|uniref:glycoside hydrolase family 5 protein n=1 Tax=Actinotalea sp. K2 TaxID=2939438 RepID=UPI0020172E0E|nr:glycoside hydrolase family 5 protein [Actinotalea sp. K2]MCL3859585.1 cellulase family glycosylhydrolase [Actinotalea sp. K2]